MFIRFLFLYILFFSVFACKNQSNTSEKTGGLEKDSITQSAIDVPEKEEEVSERGIVKEIEDAGYPFAVITIEFPERKLFGYYNINMEEVENASPVVLPTYIGKNVSFRYTSKINYALLDMLFEGKSILGMDSPPETAEIKIIEGVLEGATEETPGDIPGEISIRAEDGEKLNFEFFVTAEMVTVNGKRVKGYYDTRTKNDITSIMMSPN